MANNISRADLARRIEEGKRQAMDLFDVVSLNEGKKEGVYVDTEGNNSVGVGFNLEEKVNRDYLFKKHGLTYDDIVNKGVTLSEDQIRDLYNFNMSNAYEDAKIFDPKLDSRPHHVRVAILDLAFNLGRLKLLGGIDANGKKVIGFDRMRAALANDDYDTAAAEMKDSNWFGQVKTRGPRMINIMKSQDSLMNVLKDIRSRK